MTGDAPVGILAFSTVFLIVAGALFTFHPGLTPLAPPRVQVLAPLALAAGLGLLAGGGAILVWRAARRLRPARPWDPCREEEPPRGP